MLSSSAPWEAVSPCPSLRNPRGFRPFFLLCVFQIRLDVYAPARTSNPATLNWLKQRLQLRSGFESASCRGCHYNWQNIHWRENGGDLQIFAAARSRGTAAYGSFFGGHRQLAERWFNTGPASANVGQPWNSVAAISGGVVFPRPWTHMLCDIAPEKLDILSRCWFDVGPASQTLGQHQTSTGSMYRVFAGTGVESPGSGRPELGNEQPRPPISAANAHWPIQLTCNLFSLRTTRAVVWHANIWHINIVYWWKSGIRPLWAAGCVINSPLVKEKCRARRGTRDDFSRYFFTS